MEWVETPESSNIARFGYDANEGVLTIEFSKGGMYNYYDVPEATFTDMQAAQSKGKFHAINVKGKFRYARV